MAISYYEKGELSSGFHGWRVVVSIGGKRYQKFFSLRRPSTRISEALWHRYQETRARYYDAKWGARSAAIRYKRFISTNHPRTKPHRGSGFQGITLGIGSRSNSPYEHCYFSVNTQDGSNRFYIDEHTSLTQAWTNAVLHWGNVFEVRTKDIQEKLTHVPAPERFKSLRKYMNESERADLPVSVLHFVYAEKRAELEKQKTMRASSLPNQNQELLDFYANLEREISQYGK